MSQLYEPEKKGRPQNGGGKTPLHLGTLIHKLKEA